MYFKYIDGLQNLFLDVAQQEIKDQQAFRKYVSTKFGYKRMMTLDKLEKHALEEIGTPDVSQEVLTTATDEAEDVVEAVEELQEAIESSLSDKLKKEYEKALKTKEGGITEIYAIFGTADKLGHKEDEDFRRSVAEFLGYKKPVKNIPKSSNLTKKMMKNIKKARGLPPSAKVVTTTSNKALTEKQAIKEASKSSGGDETSALLGLLSGLGSQLGELAKGGEEAAAKLSGKGAKKNPLMMHYAYPMTTAYHNHLYSQYALNPAKDFKEPKAKVGKTMIDKDIYTFLVDMGYNYAALVSVNEKLKKVVYSKFPKKLQTAEVKKAIANLKKQAKDLVDSWAAVFKNYQKVIVPNLEKEVKRLMDEGQTLEQLLA